ncbi:phosphatidylglycerophosphatase A family protein [Thiofilum flexile]|uniref:phosphatidylglycerophosphatase A family protein n=1 Tax=Thiofilum flexile TaxID=125627 RepID=UPI00036179DD|nr:phosphatidylglycerophosphatase A [Thiofilum flexile]
MTTMVSARTVFSSPIHFLAFGLGSGLAPKAPGTFGTLAAIPIYLIMAQWSLSTYLWVVLCAFVLGVWVCGRSAQLLGEHDYGGIVWDEFVGFWITMIAAPAGGGWEILGGFILFRFFDIVKPWPIKWVDRQLPGGLGIMLDDVLAGVMAWVSLQLLAYLILAS